MSNTSPRAFDLRRISKTVPEPDDAQKRAGITFVNILFGLVVTEAAIGVAAELVKVFDKNWEAVNATRLAHLFVAIALTVLSWIGYHQSQNYPPFLVKFINIPLCQFLLDVLMVVVYYLVLAVAEGPESRSATQDPDAFPEAFLISLVFFLYVLWDLLGYRLFRDPEYTRRLQTKRPAERSFGPRRWVSVIFLLITGLFALLVALVDPDTPGGVISTDALIILVLIAYRLAKSAFDPEKQVRS